MTSAQAPEKIEILAPAGDADMLRAAVFSGADAVYLGLTAFNARRSAGNFTPAALREAVAFCHARGVRVWVTLNTTVYAQELAGVAQAVRDIAAAGADGVIVQDLGVAALVRQMAPGLGLRGSTQMSVHTLEGVRMLEKLGFSCAILARELSLNEILDIARQSPIDTEVFVHGALCMSVSGQCYMSAFLGGRSGNRGSCAGPCRLPFAADGGAGAHLSLKDMCALEHLPALQRAGVGSAKIEGRLRTPEYVAAAVSAACAARDGKPYDEALLERAFSRSGFTDGYMKGRIDGRMFGVRTAEDAAATRAALPALRELYRRERPCVPVWFTLHCEDEGIKLAARDGQGNTAVVYGAQAPQPAEKDQRPAVERALAKTGGTPFALAGLQVEGQPGFLPGAQWNELRRSALEKLLQKRQAARPIPCAPPALPAPARHTCRARLPIWARFGSWQQMPEQAAALCERAILPLAEAARVPARQRGVVLLELPRAMFGTAAASAQRLLEEAAGQGFAGFVAQNLAHLEMARGLPLHGGFGLNVTNPLAAAEYARLGLASVTVLPEVTLAQMEAIAPDVPTGAFLYGHMPLMLTRACPLHNVHGCAGCPGRGELTDRKGRRFAVECGGGVRTIYNPVPLYMGERQAEVPADYGLAWFTLESAGQCAQVLEALAAGRPWKGEFTRGLYYKGTA